MNARLRPSVLRRAVIALFAAAAVALALPTSPASAHAALLSSVPSANSIIAASPPAIELRFDEGIEASLAGIKLFDGKGAAVKVGAPQALGSDGVSASLPTLADGIYAVVWRVTSADGHPVDGAFSFQVGAAQGGDGQGLLDQVLNGTKVSSTVAWWYGVARFLALIGATLLFGVGLWSLQGRPPLGGFTAIGRVLWGSWVALTLGSIMAFGLFGAQTQGGSLGDAVKPSVWSDIAGTHTGRMLLLRVALSLVVGALLVLRGRSDAAWWRAASAIAGVAVLVTFSASGHPNSLDPRALWITLDALHLLAITVWLGGLVTFALAPPSWSAEPEAVRPAHRFSFAATICVPVIVATGVAQTLKLAGGLSDVSATTWGRMLLSKVILVVVVLAFAGVSRWLLHHDGPRGMRRTVLAEAVVGIVIIGLAAGMVAQPPRPALPSRPYNEQLVANGVIASVTISPGHVGANEVHILITPPGGSLKPIVGVTGRVLLPSASLPAAPVTIKAEGPNHFSGSVTFPRKGDWTLELLVQVTASDTVLLKSTVPIP